MYNNEMIICVLLDTYLDNRLLCRFLIKESSLYARDGYWLDLTTDTGPRIHFRLD